jgi:hypothetical protein
MRWALIYRVGAAEEREIDNYKLIRHMTKMPTYSADAYGQPPVFDK